MGLSLVFISRLCCQIVKTLASHFFFCPDSLFGERGTKKKSSGLPLTSWRPTTCPVCVSVFFSKLRGIRPLKIPSVAPSLLRKKSTCKKGHGRGRRFVVLD